MILSLNHVQITIPVGAEDEAPQFYCRVLGLCEIPKPEALQSRDGFWLELDGLQIHFGTEDGIDRARTKAHIAYEVENLELWRRKLTANSIEILDGVSIPNYRRFEFRDPFGNRVEFLERTS